MPSTVPISHLLSDVWFDRPKVEEEEYKYEVYMAKQRGACGSGVAEQIAQARQKIHQTLQGSDTGVSGNDSGKVDAIRSENDDLRKLVNTLVERMNAMEARLSKLESGSKETAVQPSKTEIEQKSESDDDVDDMDFFASDSEEDDEYEKIKQKRLAEYAEKKSKKPAVIAKSSILLDVKPWDDQTDMGEVERLVRNISTDGLKWAASKLVEVAFGIKKLQINCIVEDDKVGTDFLEEEITRHEDHVQSVDIVAFNKI
ncbi:elongation factor 1-delta-like isoform X2 [Styela clava]|uniref:elongation factor 1-delta-like isoform X2 n=1 Tax=Styela clava TaxID=7725 RepID=UPI00193A831C|nr:elongation factor 1-delta-like isoform X2 [Styela clava]